MITFRKIRWKNLLSTGNVFTEIALDKNKSTLIIGNNGSGKSTILDALTFGLFGRPFRGINKPQLVNSINQGGTLVEIEFDIGKNNYTLKRGIKRTFFEIWQNGTLLNQDASVRDYQELLEKTILKLNYKSFTQIVVLGSSTFIPFMQLRASDRRAIIEDLLDIEIFSLMNQVLRTRVWENKENVIDIDTKYAITDSKIKMVTETISDLKKDKTIQIKNSEDEIEKNKKEIENYKIEIDNFTSKNDTLLLSVSDEGQVKKKTDTLHDYQRGIEKNIIKFSEEIGFYEKNEECGTCKQGINIDFRNEMMSAFHGKMHEGKDALHEIAVDLGKLESRTNEIVGVNKNVTANLTEINKMQISTQAINEYISKVETQISDLKNRREDIEKNKNELESLENNLETYNEGKEKLSQQKYLHELAFTLLKDSGIKTRIVRQYLPIINKLINKHLGAMDFYVSFELDESFSETIKSRYRDEFTYDSFSEGERMRIDLALLFTWRAVAKLKNSVNTNLLVLDEVFDSSLDASGTEEFLKILDNLAGNVNTFVISHKGEVLFDKFDKTIKFEKYKNFSRITA